MQNGTLNLYNSVHLVSSPTVNIGLKANTLFSTGPAVNCYWKMDLGTSMHVKAVLIVGQVLDTNAGISTLANWKLTVGESSVPTLNPIFKSATT